MFHHSAYTWVIHPDAYDSRPLRDTGKLPRSWTRQAGWKRYFHKIPPLIDEYYSIGLRSPPWKTMKIWRYDVMRCFQEGIPWILDVDVTEIYASTQLHTFDLENRIDQEIGASLENPRDSIPLSLLFKMLSAMEHVFVYNLVVLFP